MSCLKRESFCFCGSLRTGTLVAGVAGIILAIAGIIVMLCVNVIFKTIVFDWLPKYVVDLIIIINFGMTVIISIVLMVGAVKRNMYLMIPWVVLGIMLAFGILVSVLYTGISFLVDGDHFNGWIWLIFGTLSFIVYLYMWMIVYSYFLVIKEETDRGQYMKDPFRRKY